MSKVDFNSWEGDVEDLRGAEDELADDPALCDRIFASKHEALLVGLQLTAPHSVSDAALDTTCKILALPWGDIGPAVQDVKVSLVLLMLLTPDAFATWENELADVAFVDEYSVSVEQAMKLPIEHRLAHVARLVRSLAMSYGLRTDYALSVDEVREQLGEVRPNSPALVLQLLDQLSLDEANRRAAHE